MAKKEKKLKSFKDLDEKELRRSAIEDFAIDVDGAEGKEDLVAAFVETGITWADYVAQHPEVAPAEDEDAAVKAKLATGGVITSGDVTGRKEDSNVAAAEAATVRVAEPVITATNDKYLIKMTRENLLYEVRGHRFTQEHPYALVDADDAQYILSQEDGFRQALPSELEEFYG